MGTEAVAMSTLSDEARMVYLMEEYSPLYKIYKLNHTSESNTVLFGLCQLAVGSPFTAMGSE